MLAFTVAAIFGFSLINPDTGEALTALDLSIFIAAPMAALGLAVSGVASLIAIFRREQGPPALKDEEKPVPIP
jgi:hypothetical protein